MKVAIIGTGVMGCGWITQCAMTGNEVHCFDSNADTLAKAEKTCLKLAGTVTKRSKIDDPEFGEKAVKNITSYSIRKAQ